jgi:hypothetical protein
MVRKRKPRRLPKRVAERIHAKKRLAKRYDMIVNRAQLKEMVDFIRNGKAKFLYRKSNNRSLWLVPYDGKMIKVVYDNHRGEIITALPPKKGVEHLCYNTGTEDDMEQKHGVDTSIRDT